MLLPTVPPVTTPTPPEPPDVPREHIDALISHAKAMAAWIRADTAAGVAHGHPEHPSDDEQAEVWDTVALALEESYHDGH